MRKSGSKVETLTPDRKPDLVMKIGKTTLEVFGPGELSEAEREARHQAVVKAVADCIRSLLLSQKRRV